MTADDVVNALAKAIGEDSLLGSGLGATTLLEADLCLDSVDLAALGAVLRDRYGTGVDLVGYVASLDIDGIIALTIGDVARYVNQAAR
jgi:hypothetical protein